MICGENFCLNVNDSVKRMGFYTTRFVEAHDEAEAERRAVDMVRQHEWSQSAVRNDRSDPPMPFADEIEELESFDEDRNPLGGQGFTFFDDETSVN